MNLKCIIQVIKCLTLGLLCPLTPFYYSSVENRGCKSSLTHWRFGNPLESWRKVCNINSIISSPSIFLAVKDKCRTIQAIATLAPVSQSPIPQCGFIIQFYIFHVASTFLSSGGPQILSNLIFLFPSLFDLIEKIKSSWKTQLPFNSLLIFTGGELKNDSFAAILILIGNSFSSNFKIITKIHSLLCQKEKGVRGWIFKLSRSFLMIYVLYVSWFIAKVTKVEIFW